jgi:LmbE family N-acetylglucosaminyl deacetylase
VEVVAPAGFFAGTGLVVVPHMDDEALACGGLLALLPEKGKWHIAYATDGRGSPEPVIPWRDRVSPDLSTIRRDEACAAMACLGIPETNLHFLNLPDSRLGAHERALEHELRQLLAGIQPHHLLIPFRYDRHSDHLALNRTATRIALENGNGPLLTEYFVYYRWRTLPAGDVRQYIRPELLKAVDTSAVAAQKRAALACYESQTTRFYAWQARPNLTAELLDAVSREPELYLRYDPALPGAAIFNRAAWTIRLMHRLEPFLKKRKDRLVAWWRRGMGPV